ncbi:MAG: hypothetical protein JF615_09605 [Asticcacaulis sp.]|nr:hypothetical protein [Asticcacaulis sp.]
MLRRAFLAGLTAVLTPLAAFARPPPGKEVLAFYYGWYGSKAHWQNPGALHHPTSGTYDSHDPAIIARQIDQAKQAGITGLIVSWWGIVDPTDQQLALLLPAAAKAGLKIAAYVENAPTSAALAEQLLYLHKTYGAASRAPFVDGVHIYDMAYYLAQKHDFAWLWRRQFYDRWVKYQKALKVTTATITPGYDDHLVPGRPPPRPVVNRDGGRLFRDLWRAAIAANPDWILIVSFNEWHEGSEIEPSAENGVRELQTCREMSARFLQ